MKNRQRKMMIICMRNTNGIKKAPKPLGFGVFFICM